MSDLFSEQAEAARGRVASLAVRMRPRTLEEFVGQERAVGPGTWLRRAIENDALVPVLLYGPAGTGKTSLARIVAGATDARFVELSAVTSGVADLRRSIDEARDALTFSGKRTIVFVDEIHRFSKSQQDALLHAVEDGDIVLIGATTENPMFEVNAPLVSRSRIVELVPLADDEVRTVVRRAVSDERGLGGAVDLDEDAEAAIVLTAGGDARAALVTLELATAAARVRGGGRPRVSAGDVADATPGRALPYDKDGDVHYDVISAFIKSMRGSDPDAAVYWLARMVHAGEDPKFIARRMMVLASEDIGNADPRALLVAAAAFKSAEAIGWPECRINLAQAAVYLALAPKSNASYTAIDEALAEVRDGPARQVPSHLRDRHRPGSDEYGPYLYPHSHPDARVEQQYLPDGLEGRRFFRPARGWEAGQDAGGADGEGGPTG